MPTPNCCCNKAIMASCGTRRACPPYFNPTRRVKESLERLVQLYEAWGKPAQAAEWKMKLDEFRQTTKATTQDESRP